VAVEAPLEPPQIALIDEQLRELRARAEAVRVLAESGDEESLRTTAARLADAVLDLDAVLTGGNALPSAWREPSTASDVDRLTWVCRRVWSRLRDGLVATVGLTETLSYTRDGRNDVVLIMAVCNLAPRAVTGETALEALRWLASYGAAEVARVHGADDPAVGETLARLVDVGLMPVPRGQFDFAAIEAF
jgi:hypothetical protein